MTFSISAFFPAYNDQHTIEGMVRTVAAELARLTDDFEVLVVNDGSRDDTPKILDRLEREIPQFRAIHHPRNMGYGAALITGFREASKDVVFYTDGDGQYDVRELPLLVNKLHTNVDVVTGYKKVRSDAWYRILLGEIYRRCMRFAFSLPVRDVDCDFRLFRRHVVDAIALDSHSGVICVEMIRKVHVAGFNIAEVPVTHLPRMHGSSQFFSFRHLSRVVAGLVRIWFVLVILPALRPKPDQVRIQAERSKASNGK